MTYLPFFDPPIPDSSHIVPFVSSFPLPLRHGWLAAREMASGRPAGERGSSSARRAGPPTIWRGRWRLSPATFGIERLSFTQLAARTALVALADRSNVGQHHARRRGCRHASRIRGDARRRAPVLCPGRGDTWLSTGAGETLQELRLAKIGGPSLSPLPLAGPDLATLLERFDACFADARSVDRAGLFRTAAAVLRGAKTADGRKTYDCRAARHLAGSCGGARVHRGPGGRASSVLATVPSAIANDSASRGDGRGSQKRTLGSSQRPGRVWVDSSSTPRASRRCASWTARSSSSPRRAKDANAWKWRGASLEARAGVPFDEMAILVRSPTATSVSSNMRCGGRACRARSIAARGGPIRQAARFSRCSRVPPNSSRRRALPSIFRWVRCRIQAGPLPASPRLRRTSRRTALRDVSTRRSVLRDAHRRSAVWDRSCTDDGFDRAATPTMTSTGSGPRRRSR